MKAIQFNATIPRYAIGLAFKRFYPPILWGGLSCTYLDDLPDLKLPGNAWVKVKTLLGGICGSDLSAVNLSVSPYWSSLLSSPSTLGHENVGRLVEVGPDVKGWRVGERVVVEPTLWCLPRGIEELCRYCERGEINRCERTTQGAIAPGWSIGFCRDTGGSWSPYFLAHESQLYRLPDELSDENGLMVEPFAVGLHAVLGHFPSPDATVLVMGAGTIGLVTVAALRALGSAARVLVIARYPFQAEAARRLGADEVILAQRGVDLLAAVVERTGARILKPLVGKRVVEGGVDQTFECVGSYPALDDSLRLTRRGGKVILVGVPGLALVSLPGIFRGVDWTSIFDKELQVAGAYIYNHAETYQGKPRRTYDLAIELLASGQVDLTWMVNQKFGLEQYAEALAAHSNRGGNQIIKAVFAFED